MFLLMRVVMSVVISVAVFTSVSMLVFVRMLVGMMGRMRMMCMRLRVCDPSVMGMLVREVNVELHAFDSLFMGAAHVQVEFVQTEFVQLRLQSIEIQSQIDQRTDQHVTADAAKDVQIESLHDQIFSASALIWLAA